MSKIYIEDIQYAITDALEMEYGIYDTEWGIGIDSSGDPYVDVYDDLELLPISSDDGHDDDDIMIGIGDNKYLSTQELFDAIFSDDSKKEDVSVPTVVSWTMSIDSNGNIIYSKK